MCARIDNGHLSHHITFHAQNDESCNGHWSVSVIPHRLKTSPNEEREKTNKQFHESYQRTQCKPHQKVETLIIIIIIIMQMIMFLIQYNLVINVDVVSVNTQNSD